MELSLNKWIEQRNKKLEQEDMDDKIYRIVHKRLGYVVYETNSLEDAIETKKIYGRSFVVED